MHTCIHAHIHTYILGKKWPSPSTQRRAVEGGAPARRIRTGGRPPRESTAADRPAPTGARSARLAPAAPFQPRAAAFGGALRPFACRDGALAAAGGADLGCARPDAVPALTGAAVGSAAGRRPAGSARTAQWSSLGRSLRPRRPRRGGLQSRLRPSSQRDEGSAEGSTVPAGPLSRWPAALGWRDGSKALDPPQPGLDGSHSQGWTVPTARVGREAKDRPGEPGNIPPPLRRQAAVPGPTGQVTRVNFQRPPGRESEAVRASESQLSQLS